MKLTLRQALLFLVGGTAGALGMQNASSTAHADVVTVKSGDTTWGLSKKYGTTVKKIVKDNHLNNGGKDIYVDQKLNIKNNNKVKTAYADTKITSSSAQSAVSQGSSTQSSQQQGYNYGNSQTPAYSSSANSISTNYHSSVSGDEQAAKNWIAARESGSNYNAVNASSGAYGKFQLLPGYLNGDYSPANQERTADNYVSSRYGSWTAAKAFWEANGWY